MHYLNTEDWPTRYWRDQAIHVYMHTNLQSVSEDARACYRTRQFASIPDSATVHVTVEAWLSIQQTLWALCEMANWCEETHTESPETPPKPNLKEQ